MKALLCSALISLVSPVFFVQAIPTPQSSEIKTIARDTATQLRGKRIADVDILVFSTFHAQCIFDSRSYLLLPLRICRSPRTA